MRGSFLKNYDMFTKLCGDDAMTNVVLVTTKWAQVSQEVGEAREQQLKKKFWASMLNLGSATARFMHTPKSAWDIVDLLVPKEQLRALAIQHELLDLGRSLPETRAGITLREHLEAELKEYERTIRSKKKAIAVQNGLDKTSLESQAKIEKQIHETETRIQTIFDQIQELKIGR
jgi:hypothetical protein